MKKAFTRTPRSARNFALAILLAASPAVVAGAQVSDQDAAEQRLWCPCGCNQSLGECNHIGCPSAGPMRAEVTTYLDEGLDVDAVLARFREKYGPEILTVPSTGTWFDLAAWILPFAGLVAGIGGAGLYVRRFRRRWRSNRPEDPAADAPAATEFGTRIEDELADFTPED